MPGIYRENAEALKDQTYRQVHELLTNYGQIDVLWWDGGSDDWLGLGGLEWNGAWHQRDVEKTLHRQTAVGSGQAERNGAIPAATDYRR